MAYFIGQALGIIATFLGISIPFWKKKSQMLICTALTNFLVACNFLLIGKIGSAFVMDLVAVAQSFVSLRHVQKGSPVSKAEHILFLLLYVGLGFAGIISAPGFVPELSAANLLELLPIAAAVLCVFSVFVRDEQKTRALSLGNAALWVIYDAIVGTTAVFSQIFSFIAITAALIRYRKRR